MGEGSDDLLCGGCGWACGDQKSIAAKKSTFLVREISLLILWSKPILLVLNLKMIKLGKRNCSKVFKRTFSLIGTVTYTAGRSNNWLLLAEKYIFFTTSFYFCPTKEICCLGHKTTLVCQQMYSGLEKKLWDVRDRTRTWLKHPFQENLQRFLRILERKTEKGKK